MATTKTDPSGRSLEETRTAGLSYQQDGDVWYTWASILYHAEDDPTDVYDIDYWVDAEVEPGTVTVADPTDPTDTEARAALYELKRDGDEEDWSRLGRSIADNAGDPTWAIETPGDD